MSTEARTQSLNFLLCPSYHGATILSILLANHSQISALGDTIPKKMGFELICSCGKKVSQCEFWQTISRRLYASELGNSKYLLPLYPSLFQHERLNELLNRGVALLSVYLGTWIWKLTGRGTKAYLNKYLKFYRLVCEIQGTSVFLDGQKRIYRVLLARGIMGKGTPINVLHLTRDPRGAFYSAKKRKRFKELTPETYAKIWTRYHKYASSLQKVSGINYMLLRYEDFCQVPAQSMEQVFRLFQVANEEVIRPADYSKEYHQIGNQIVKTRFDGRIKCDFDWQDKLSAEIQVKLAQLTRPLSEQWDYTQSFTGEQLLEMTL